MSGLDLLNELSQLVRQLPIAVDMMRERGINLAKKEQIYKVKKMQETLKLRDKGMAIGLIGTTVDGICAKEKLDVDIALVEYDTAKERINALKKQTTVLNDQIQREWHSNDTQR